MNSVMITIKTYGNNSKLVFTDTDCVLYEIKTEDVY